MPDQGSRLPQRDPAARTAKKKSFSPAAWPARKPPWKPIVSSYSIRRAENSAREASCYNTFPHSATLPMGRSCSSELPAFRQIRSPSSTIRWRIPYRRLSWRTASPAATRQHLLPNNLVLFTGASGISRLYQPDNGRRIFQWPDFGHGPLQPHRHPAAFRQRAPGWRITQQRAERLYRAFHSGAGFHPGRPNSDPAPLSYRHRAAERQGAAGWRAIGRSRAGRRRAFRPAPAGGRFALDVDR